MATDPVAPVTPIPTLLPPSGTPESIKSLREYVKQLASQKYTPPNSKYPFYTWANGLSDASGKIMSGLASHEADERERNLYGGLAKSATTGLDAPAASSSAPPSEEGSPRASTRSEADPYVPKDASEAAIRLTSRGETGSPDLGYASLGNISPDTGGSKSYGTFGLNSHTGSAANFASTYPHLNLTAKPGSPEFDAQWKNAAKADPDAMREAHLDYHARNIMPGLRGKMTDAGVHPDIANDPRVQIYMADRRVQMGDTGLGKALRDAKTVQDPQKFLEAVSAADRANIGSNFRSYLSTHPNDSRGLSNRIDLRHNESLKFQPSSAPAGDSSPTPAVEAPAAAGSTSSPGRPGLPAGALKFASAEIPGGGGIDHDFAQKMIAAQIAKNGGPQPMNLAQATPLPSAPQQPARQPLKVTVGPSPATPPADQVTGVPPANATFNAAPGRPTPSLPAEVPPPGTTGGTVGGLGAAAGRLVPPGPAAPRPAPTAAPAAPPASAAPAGPPQFIPPTAQMPPHIVDQIQSMIRSGIPGVVSEGYKMRDEWQNKIQGVTQVERGGMIYSGNPYLGYKATGIPAKPEIKDFNLDVSGVKLPRVGKPVYDAAGNHIGYQQMPLTPPGGAPGSSSGAAGAGSTAGPITGKDPFNPNWSEPQIIDWASKRQVEQREQEAYAGEQGKSYGTKQDSIAKGYEIAQEEVPQLEMLKQVMSHPNYNSGALAGRLEGFSSAAQQLGLSTGESATLLQFATKLGQRASLANIQELGQLGAVRVPEMNMISKSNYSNENTPEANRAAVDVQLRLAKRKAEIGEFQQNYLDTGNIQGGRGQGSGRIDRNFDKQVRDYYKDHDLFDKNEVSNYTNLFNKEPGATTAPAAEGLPRISSPEDARKLPSGSKFIAPNGHIGTVP
jgi:hypothetical protein